MSRKEYEDAMNAAPKCRFFRTVGGRSEKEIDESEKILDITFSYQCRNFYKRFGYLSFYGNEIYGINPNDKSGILAGNSLLWALNDRREYNLPKEWLPIFDTGDGSMAYLDYSKLNNEGEPKVIEAIYDGKQYQMINVIAEDFGQFLWERVKEALS